MIFIVLGCLAFVFLYLFDLNKILLLNNYFNVFFAMGIFLLVFSTLGILRGNFNSFEVSIYFRLLWGALSLISMLLMLYSLFFALPFSNTYLKVEKTNAVVDTGMYSLCRHPGVIWFFFFYLFLSLASGLKMMILAGIIWTIMDVVHVYVQDRWLFPKAMPGYGQYKCKVPFLIPNVCCVKRILLP